MTVAPSRPALAATSAQPTAPSWPMRPFSVDEYHRLIETGVLTEDDAVELLEGWIVYKMPRNPPHGGTIDLAAAVLRSRLLAGWYVRVQNALTTAESEPEPDLVIASGGPRDYLTRHPGPGDVALVVEVANTSLARDQDEKARLYARAGIAVYWIINLADLWVEVYTDPTGPAPAPEYRRRQDYGPGTAVPLAVPGQPAALIPVNELLP